MLAIIGISHEKTWQLGSDSQGPDMKEPYRKKTKGHYVGYNREDPAQEKHGSNGLCPNSVSTPPPQANGRFVGAIFAENLSIFENSGFDFGNGYFDDYYGQTLFLDCILMDIMIYNGEIWCKLSALVMVYIH